MHITRPELTETREGITYQVKLTATDYPGKLWYEVRGPYQDFVSGTSDAALAALLIPAMQRGEDIYLEGEVCSSLLFEANNDLQALFRIFHPKLKPIRIQAEGVYNHSQMAENVATGFSGGIDSFFTLSEHFYREDVAPEYRITHLLYNNVGSHGGGGQRLWAERYQRLKRLPEKLGLPFIAVNSNQQEFYPTFSFIQTHTPRDASVGLLLQKGIGKYLYSSSINYPHLKLSPQKAITFSDSIILPKLSTSSIRLMSAGSSTSRVDKTRRVAEVADSYEFLDVCIDESNEKNCSRCLKCMKTQLTLDVAGKLDKYGKVFNREIYQANRIRFISSIHRSPSIHLHEILDFAKTRNYPIPRRTWFYSWFRIYGLLRLGMMVNDYARNVMSEIIHLLETGSALAPQVIRKAFARDR